MNSRNSASSGYGIGRAAGIRLASAVVTVALAMLLPWQGAVASTGDAVIRSGKDVRLELAGPTSLDRGVATAGYTIHLSNPDAVDVEDDVLVRFELVGENPILPEDVVIEVESVPGSGDFAVLPVQSCWSDVCADFGGAGGFPMAAGYDVTTTFRITLRAAGIYTLRVGAIGVHSLNQYAGATLVQTVVAPAVAIELSGPTSIGRSTSAAGFAAAFANEGDGAVPEGVILRYEFIGAVPLTTTTLTSEIESAPGSGEYVQMILTVCGSSLCGDTGSLGTFALPAGYIDSLAMRNTVEETGTFEIKARVVGADSGTEYAIAVHTFEVVSQPASLMVIAGQDQTAIIGTAVAVAPAIRVEDAGGAPVAGVDVVFRISSGGGNVSESSVTSDVDGVAAPTSWTLGENPGLNELLVQVPGSNASPVMVDAMAIVPVEVSVSVATQAPYAAYGGNVEYTIVVGNGGATSASAVSLDVLLPVSFVAESATWTCTAVGGAQCVASGQGAIAETLDLPPGASAVFVLAATIAENAGDSATVLAQVDHADDFTPADNTAAATSEIVLQRSSFEIGEPDVDGHGGTPIALGSLAAQNILSLELPAFVDSPITTVALGMTDAGERFRIELIAAGDARVLRISVHHTDATIDAGAVVLPATTHRIDIGLAGELPGQAGTRLLVVGEGVDIDLPFGAVEAVEVDGYTD